nr:MAG TPA: hypothetical protein [Caudoviricetes sp.]
MCRYQFAEWQTETSALYVNYSNSDGRYIGGAISREWLLIRLRSRN